MRKLTAIGDDGEKLLGPKPVFFGRSNRASALLPESVGEPRDVVCRNLGESFGDGFRFNSESNRMCFLHVGHSFRPDCKSSAGRLPEKS